MTNFPVVKGSEVPLEDTLLSALAGGGVGTSDEKRLTALRQCAEALAQNYLSEDSLNDNTLSPAQAIETLHELRVHKIELEMQLEELSRTQSELDISRTRYMDFYDLAPVGYCTLSSKGLISEVNLTTTTLLNVPRSQLIKQPISRFILKEDHTTYYQFRHEVRNTHKSLSCELRLLKREGAPFWVHLLATAVQYHDGGSELRIVLTDITERKKVEAALRESEERYRSLVEWTPEPVVVHGAGKTLYVNPAAIKMFGATSASDLVGKPTLDLIHPDFRKTVAERVKVNAEPGGSTPVLEKKLLKLDGSVIDVEVQGIQINFNGKPAIQAAMRDVTQRKAAEQALSESEFRWRFAVEGTGDGLWDWDVAQSTVLFSKRWKEMLGFSQAEIGNGLDEWSKRVHPDDLARVMVDVQAHLDGATADYVNEHRVSCKDGSWKWILDRGLVVNRDPAGTPLRMIGTHTDITER
ncbi:MAG: PAS domain S-box protein, partial [Comamonadaceae bacterium]